MNHLYELAPPPRHGARQQVQQRLLLPTRALPYHRLQIPDWNLATPMVAPIVTRPDEKLRHVVGGTCHLSIVPPRPPKSAQCGGHSPTSGELHDVDVRARDPTAGMTQDVFRNVTRHSFPSGAIHPPEPGAQLSILKAELVCIRPMVRQPLELWAEREHRVPQKRVKPCCNATKGRHVLGRWSLHDETRPVPTTCRGSNQAGHGVAHTNGRQDLAQLHLHSLQKCTDILASSLRLKVQQERLSRRAAVAGKHALPTS